MVCLASLSSLPAADLASSLEQGSVNLKSAGPLAFAPEGILLVGDPEGAAIYAIATGETSGNPDEVRLNIDKVDEKVASALGTTSQDILIEDLAVNPLSGNAYLSVSRGRGPEAAAVILRVTGDGKISEVSLKNVKSAKAVLPNPPAPGGTGRQNLRSQAITDLDFVDGRVIVAGLSNEEFASTLRAIPFPFSEADAGAGVEIFHGAHGRFETRSPVRTFAAYAIGNEPHLLAAYTCTPLVKFPIKDLKAGAKVRGTTVAELGNRNRPLDMIIYDRDGKDYILMANSSRGMMKISTDELEREEGITSPIRGGGTAGQKYETIEDLSGVVQLARLNRDHALVVLQTDDGLNLATVALP